MVYRVQKRKELVKMIRDRLRNGLEEFLNGDEFEMIIKHKPFYSDPLYIENVYNRTLDQLTTDLKRSTKFGKFAKVRNCQVFPDYDSKDGHLKTCFRGGEEKAVNNRVKYYCSYHEKQRVKEWNAYHRVDVERYRNCPRRNQYNFQRKAATEHSRRIKYRNKYNLEHDYAHGTHEEKLQRIYEKNFRVDRKNGRIEKVSNPKKTKMFNKT